MYTSVEIKKNGNKYFLFIDGKFVKEGNNIAELTKVLGNYE